MSKSATLESNPDLDLQPKRARKARVRNADASESLSVSDLSSGDFPTKPLLLGVGIGAALALTAVALASRPTKSGSFGSNSTFTGALAKTAALMLARMVARKALAAAANQGARKLANAWPM